MNSTPHRLVVSRTSGPARSPEAGRSRAAQVLLSNPSLVRSLLALLFALAAPGRVGAQVPDRLSFQGYLEDGNTNAIGKSAPVNLPTVFRIYSASTGGTLLWSESQTVTFDNGNYSVVLGEGAQYLDEVRPALSTVVATGGSELYVELTVRINNTDARLMPRLRLLPTPYAFLASTALKVDAAAINSGTIDNARLSASIVSGVIPDNRLTANVALKSAANTFGPSQKFTDGIVVGPTASDIFGTRPMLSLNPSGGAWLGLNDASGATKWHVNNFQGGIDFVQTGVAAGRLILGSNGNVGIGGSPGNAYKLEVLGKVFGTSVDAQANLWAGSALGLGGGPANPQVYISMAGSDLSSRVVNGSALNFVPVNQRIAFDVGAAEKFAVTAAGARIYYNNTLEFGYGYTKEGSAGKIGYKSFSTDKLDIVGAGSSAADRKIQLWAEGGVFCNGVLWVTGSSSTYLVDQNNPFSNFKEGIDTFETRGNRDVGPDETVNISINADRWIASAYGFIAYSDRRIKKDFRPSDGGTDLAAIRQLHPTDYRMVDSIADGTAWRKGFVAQEVEQVIPGAVSRSVEFIPDVFALATSADYDAARQTVRITLNKEHGLTVGNRVRLHLDERRLDLEVSAVPSAREFVVTKCDRAPKKVFVYGRQVSDFRTVDYDRIFTTGIGAIQELARQVEDLQSKQAQLATVEAKGSEAVALRKENAALRAKIEQQDQRLAALEKLVRKSLSGLQEAALRTKNGSN